MFVHVEYQQHNNVTSLEHELSVPEFFRHTYYSDYRSSKGGLTFLPVAGLA